MDHKHLDREGFQALKSKAEHFRYQSLQYYDAEDFQEVSLLRNDENLLLLSAMENGTRHHLWAADRPREIVRELQDTQGSILLSFVPDDFAPVFAAEGFTIHAEYEDYFNQDIVQTCVRYGLKENREIKFAVNGDHSVLSKLAGICTGPTRGFDAESEDWYREWLQENNILMLPGKNKPLGYCCVGRYADVVWIRRLAVDAAYQGRGFGRILLEQALFYGLGGGAARGFLHVDRSNEKAIALYQKYGFAAQTDCGERIMIRKNRQIPERK